MKLSVDFLHITAWLFKVWEYWIV